jgi:BirA family transcriptional regulator, biotin operon repressor / biotin---[acetyl-CoA-carboxylase] ligase
MVPLDRQDATHAQLVLEMLLESGTDFASGEALSGKLGLSRTAVWKVVNALRDRGYAIEAVPSRGYRLVRVPDRLTALEVSPLLETHDLGRTVHAFDTIGSTSEHAFRLAAEGAEHGEVVVSETQTAGRGRRGRTWASPPGKNLYVSVVLRPELPPQRAPELTLLAAVAVAETLQGDGVKASIKWPNDIQAGVKKIAGILTELSAEADRVHFVVLGIGVNLNATSADFPPEVAEMATSVTRVLGGRKVNRAAFLARLLRTLEHWLDTHEQEGFEPVRERWRELSSTLGQEVLVKSERRELRGVAEDIDTDGALLLRTENGRERVLAGDVEQVRTRVRP